MAKSRMEKNKELYDSLEDELKNNKEKKYEDKLKSIDPVLNYDEKEQEVEKNAKVESKKTQESKTSVLAVIAKEVKGDSLKKTSSKKEEKPKEIENIKEDEEINSPISFTDKLSVEEILRVKIEKQQKMIDEKRALKKGPTGETYTSEMMQERIRQDIGIDVRKETKIKVKNYRWVGLLILCFALVLIITIGVLLILKVIEL